MTPSDNVLVSRPKWEAMKTFVALQSSQQARELHSMPDLVASGWKERPLNKTFALVTSPDGHRELVPNRATLLKEYVYMVSANKIPETPYRYSFLEPSYSILPHEDPLSIWPSSNLLQQGGWDFRGKEEEVRAVYEPLNLWAPDVDKARAIMERFRFGGAKVSVETADIEEGE